MPTFNHRWVVFHPRSSDAQVFPTLAKAEEFRAERAGSDEYIVAPIGHNTQGDKNMHATTIVGYTYNADIYCTHCIVKKLPTGEGEAFDGWALADGITMSTEDNLNEIAAAFGIDRWDETSFDSAEFPKVVFADMAAGDEHCGACGEPLID